MENSVREILREGKFGIDAIVTLLKSKGEEQAMLFRESARIKYENSGNKVFYRGLIEFSNICKKDCYYCGIRKSNKDVERYNLSDTEIIDAARYAYESRYGSLVLQSGELSNPEFTGRITRLLKEIKKITGGRLGITLSLGEQTEEVYRQWFDAGAHRYLLRIEASNPVLYSKLHPNDSFHNYLSRLESLSTLQKVGYQTGTGVMIGLPFQTYEDLAGDLIFMRQLDVDMVGMGPYIEHANTPLAEHKDKLMPPQERFDLSLRMIAILRLMMKDINIAASTAMQALDPAGREKAIQAGANVLMPNITPGIYRDNYNLYENKPRTDDSDDDYRINLEARLARINVVPAYGEWGDSRHYHNRQKDKQSD